MKSVTYISRLVSKAGTIPWGEFLPPTFPKSLHESLRNWSVHPREPFDLRRKWTGVQDSMLPRINFYLEASRKGFELALEIFASIGKRVGSWGACACHVTFAAHTAESWGFDHRLSIDWRRCWTDEPAMCSFSFGRHKWDQTNAPAQADFWNQWVKRFEMPVKFFVSEGHLVLRYAASETLLKPAQSKHPHSKVEKIQKVETGFDCPTENPPLQKWFNAFRDVLDSRKVVIELWHYDLPPGMSRESAMQRLLSEALPHISGTIWNDWTIDGFITKLEGLETLQAYSGPDDQHAVELGKMTIKKGGQADLFLLVERAGFRLAIESKKPVPSEVLDQLEHDSGFTFYRTPARERPAPTSYTLKEKHYLPPEGATDDPGPEVPFDLQKWTKEFHRSQKTTKPKPTARRAKK